VARSSSKDELQVIMCMREMAVQEDIWEAVDPQPNLLYIVYG
jgi:hypothetical protein